MKSKLALALLLASAATALATSPAHAISAKYRQQLERSGCTEMSDADGSCDIHKTKAQNTKASSGSKGLAAEADHVMNKPISDSAEYLLSKGWKPNNGVWKKQGSTLMLTVENDTVVNVQLTKG